MMPGKTARDRVAVGLLLLAAWQLASYVAGAYWVSPPLATLQKIVGGVTSGDYFFHGAFTLGAALLGFVIGAVPGVLLPMLLRRRRVLRRILDPFLVAGYGLPKLALAPLFILWFGIGIESKVALVARVVFFLVFFNTLSGVESVDTRILQMARVAGAGDWQISQHVIWPSVVPHVFAGIRIATPYAIGGVVISELISSNRGLGYLVQLGAMNFSTPHVFGAIVAITVMTGVSSWVVDALEGYYLRWRPADAGASSPAAEH